jgi:predicted Zn-dependent protease
MKNVNEILKGRIIMRIIGRIRVILLILPLFLLSCSTVPITGRSQINIVPDSTLFSMSFNEYDEFLKNNKISKDAKLTQMVQNVGKRLQYAVEQYFSGQGMSDQLKDYKWEFNLVENKEVNAWCMPGGKVVVYTGIMDVAKDDNGLAVVMGHEIGHAIAKHGNERMSQGLIAQMGGVALSTALQSQPAATQQLWMTVFGIGAQYGVMLPYSRLQETEADELGLIFMAMAGYDPNEAVGFWTRMSEKKAGKGAAEFMSTHPSDETRISNIKKFIPTAMQYYKKQ